MNMLIKEELRFLRKEKMAEWKSGRGEFIGDDNANDSKRDQR
jgi:hypothetical protein